MHSYLHKLPTIRRSHLNHLVENFAAFVRAAWHVVCPGRKLIWSPAYGFFAEVLTLMMRRDPRYRRVIWNQPPRTLKSLFASVAFPVWLWLSEPNHQFVCASYAMELSIKFSIDRRNLICSPWFQELFGDRFQLAYDRNLTSQFSNNHGGAMLATSTGARLTGFGFDTCIADDLTSPDMALSDAERTTVNNWFDRTLRQRANDPASSSILVISQRTHELDVPGHLLETEPGTWTRVKIPLRCEEATSYSFPLSGRVWQRSQGDVLMAKRFPPKVVAELEKRRLVFASQYQQEPAPIEGNLIKRSEVKYFGGIDPVTGVRDEPLPDSFDVKLISVDCAFKSEAHHDKVALLAIGVKGRKRYILEARNRHLDVIGTEEEIRWLRGKHQANVVLVEDKANGPAVTTRLKNSFPAIIPVNPQGGKDSRMYAAAAEWQAGDWYLERGGGWVEEFILQITQYPKGRWDDLCDAMSQASVWLQAHPGYGEGVPFQRVARAGPAAWLRAVVFRSWGGFPEQRSIVPPPSHTMGDEAAAAAARIASGHSREDDIDKVMWDSIKDFM